MDSFCTQKEAIEVIVRGLVDDLSTVTINHSYSSYFKDCDKDDTYILKMILLLLLYTRNIHTLLARKLVTLHSM